MTASRPIHSTPQLENGRGGLLQISIVCENNQFIVWRNENDAGARSISKIVETGEISAAVQAFNRQIEQAAVQEFRGTEDQKITESLLSRNQDKSESVKEVPQEAEDILYG